MDVIKYKEKIKNHCIAEKDKIESELENPDYTTYDEVETAYLKGKIASYNEILSYIKYF